MCTSLFFVFIEKSHLKQCIITQCIRSYSKSCENLWSSKKEFNGTTKNTMYSNSTVANINQYAQIHQFEQYILGFA